MAVIKINQFGGEMPSASSRVIPAGQARRAFNLLARVNEFRPLQKDVVKATPTATAGATLYRFSIDSSGNPLANDTLGWISAAAAMNYAKGQIDDLGTERVYISTLDGSIAPIVIDATGVQKPLGVPAPAAAPGVTHNVVNEYSVDEDTAARLAIPIELADAVKAALSTIAIGASPSGAPSAGVAGWLAHGASMSSGTLPTTTLGDWAFLVPMTGSVMSSANDQWLMATEFGGNAVGYGGNSFWAVPVTLQGVGYSVNQTTLSTGIKAIVNPDVGGQLVPNANADAAALAVANDFALTTSPQANDIAALAVARAALEKAISDYANNTALAAEATAFYAKTSPVDVAGEITDTIQNFANDLVSAEGGIVAAPLDWNDVARWTTPTLTLASVFVGYATSAFTVVTDGTKNLDTEALRAAITTNIAAVIASIGTGCTADDKKTLNGRIAAAIDPLISRLANALNPAHWASYTGWPLSASYSQTSTNNSRSAAVASAIANLKAAAHKVTADYEAIMAKLADTVRNIFDAKGGIAEQLPTPVTRLVDSRFYVTTMVTSWGEESSPSLPSTQLNVDQNDNVTITRPTELGVSGTVSTYLLTGWRLYRSNVGTAGTSFQLVGPGITGWDADNGYFPNAITSVTDNLTTAELQEVLPSLTWLPPPVQTALLPTYPYLRDIVGMANGIMAGHIDNRIYFSEAFVPYAYPEQYALTTKHKIVGKSSFGNSLFVGTEGVPYLFTGNDPASMSPQELPGNQACVSARSIASIETGALYASPDGICLADYNGVKVVTLGLFTKDDWKALNPSSIVGAMHHGVYYFLYNNRSTTGAPIPALGLTAPNPNAAAFTALYEGLKAIITDGNEVLAREIYNAKQTTYGFADIDFAPYTGFTAAQIGLWKTNTAFTTTEPGTLPSHTTRVSGCYALDFVSGKLTELDISGTAFFVDIKTDTLYMLDGTQIKALFTDTTQFRTGDYWTGIIQTPKYEPFAWLQVDSVFTTAATIKWYGDGVLRHVASVSTNAPVRLPSGRYREHQIHVQSVDRITSVTMAGSTDELKQA